MRHAVLLLAAAAALVLPACGSSKGGGASTGASGPPNDVALAAVTTGSQKTAKVSLHVTTSGGPTGGTFDVAGAGQIDIAAHRFRLTATVGGASPLAAGTKIEEILDGTTLYVRSPIFARLTSSDRWLKFDLQQLGSKLGVNFSQLLSSGTSDPTQGLSYLKATSGSVQKLGTEDVRGVSTTHYHAIVDLERYPDVVPASQREAAKRNVEQIKRLTGTTQIPEDVWIDGQHRVRRFSTSEDVQPQTGDAAGAKAHVETTGELYDFGAPVDVSPPPASDTEDATKLIPSSLGAG